MDPILAALLKVDVFTHYLVEMSPKDAKAFLAASSKYNFIPKDIDRIVDVIGEIVPPMQFDEGNPNNGKPHHQFLIGNEGSRVVYLQINKYYMPKDFNYKLLIADLGSTAKRFHADEFFVTKDEEGKHGTFEYRFWWD